jgi:hypothetical protein
MCNDWVFLEGLYTPGGERDATEQIVGIKKQLP